MRIFTVFIGFYSCPRVLLSDIGIFAVNNEAFNCEYLKSYKCQISYLFFYELEIISTELFWSALNSLIHHTYVKWTLPSSYNVSGNENIWQCTAAALNSTHPHRPTYYDNSYWRSAGYVHVRIHTEHILHTHISHSIPHITHHTHWLHNAGYLSQLNFVNFRIASIGNFSQSYCAENRIPSTFPALLLSPLKARFWNHFTVHYKLAP